MLSILVVIYNKDMRESKTLETLSLHNYDIKPNLVIVNNGPKKILEDKIILDKLNNIYKVEMLQKIHNEPLSNLYNWFVRKFRNEFYSILDDDSDVDCGFFDKVFKVHGYNDLIIPVIKMNNNTPYYPYINNEIISEEFSKIEPGKNIKSITSGMIFSEKIVSAIESTYKDIFDERYVLYGVDSSFFSRINSLTKCGLKIEVITNSIMYHDLSRAGKLSKNNLQERIIDMAISYRNYPESISFKHYFKANLKLLLLGHFKSVFLSVLSYFRGYHPRSRKGLK